MSVINTVTFANKNFKEKKKKSSHYCLLCSALDNFKCLGLLSMRAVAVHGCYTITLYKSMTEN